ncbi:hypothetical protein QEH59_17680, partial [Coraliomargarita sp. SDUM461004]
QIYHRGRYLPLAQAKKANMPQKNKAKRQPLAKSQDKKRIQRTSSNYGPREGTLNYAMAL